MSVEIPVTRFKEGVASESFAGVATEVPLTIMANGIEIATLLASPANIRELTYGYLFTSGFINGANDVLNYHCDTQRWVAEATITKNPDPEMMRKRLYTSGCGKCAMYASVQEISLRRPVDSPLRISSALISDAASWINESSSVFKETGGVHAAGLIDKSMSVMLSADDVARHNAVDKVIGAALLEGRDINSLILVRTGRTSSEIVFKARRAGIAITISRGAPTHQAVLLAKEMGITLIGFARKGEFTAYSHKERIDM
jgi:FdhD protein